MKFIVGPTDLLIILAYLGFIVGLGLWAGWSMRRKSKGNKYFLAGRSLTWPIIGLALFATNISTIELVSLAEEGYKSGLVYGNLEWMAVIPLIILAIFFAPFFIRSSVTTLPDFLLKRYNNNCRKFHVIISILSAIFIHIGFALFAGAKVLEGLFNMDIFLSITLILGLTGLYTIIGGLRSVVLTEAVQAIVLVGGSFTMTVIGFNKVGGWDGLTESLDPVMFTMLRSAEAAPNMSWYSVLLGYPIIGIWYYCTDQTIVQRVLAAKDERNAQLGSVFAGFIKILPVFIFVMPGMICLALIRQGALPDELEDTAQTYSFLIANILPEGVKGVVVAAMLSALMSTVAGALNSIATLFCYDIYKPCSPGVSDERLVVIGRIATVAAIGLAILWAPQISKFGSILEGNTAMISYVAPSITAVFLGGVLWKGASAKGAFITLLSGFILGIIVFLLDWNRDVTGWDYSFLIVGFWLFILSSIILAVSSFTYPQVNTQESDNLVWKTPLHALKLEGWTHSLNYKSLSLLLLAVIVTLYVVFA